MSGVDASTSPPTSSDAVEQAPSNERTGMLCDAQTDMASESQTTIAADVAQPEMSTDHSDTTIDMDTTNEVQDRPNLFAELVERLEKFPSVSTQTTGRPPVEGQEALLGTEGQDAAETLEDLRRKLSRVHDWVGLEEVELNGPFERHCDTDDDDEKTADEAEDGDTADESSDDDESSDELDEMLEDTVFALQHKLYFVSRIMCHGCVSVYRAICRETLEDVCVKIVARHDKSDDERLPIEPRILAIVREGDDAHPGKSHVQRLISYHSSPSCFVTVSELHEEQSFRRHLFGRPDDIREVMRQLLQAIDYLHSLDIISRDIKCSNMLWDGNTRHLMLCDFDLATFETEKGHHAVLGTDGFMAPEVMEHESSQSCGHRYGKSIDVYSAGVVFGTLLHSIRENNLTVSNVNAWKKRLKRKKDELDPAEKLLKAMLSGDASTRPNARACLSFDYFNSN